ncbi:MULTISPECIES: DUF192 domain-containing protein [Marinobacter]|uniref:DUF192 domain-containing protein n=1 Tax=Marinobacter xiaoshiensis TaxID=3073652 RepID=A0ABU2HIW9_9GAMM|nr:MULTISPECIES: DUF192 domain-containing protein [unclassified Marinobacter]MDS1310708.1 DUF192 domain-containing protein [Marinobacter sp. F60267]
MDFQNRLPAAHLMRYRYTLLCFVATLAGCSGSAAVEPSVGLPVIEGCFVTASNAVSVSLELARAPRDRQKGLMGRKSMATSSGMLFEYQEQQSPDHGFWMFQTLIPLDIAYLNNQGVIGNIKQMEPCDSSSGARCPSYPAEVAFISAVEMNAGFFEANDIGVGDRLKLGEQNCSNR